MRDSPEDSLAYARQMGHTHVIYCHGMENSPLAEGMYFYFNDPEFSLRRLALDFNRKYSEKEIDYTDVAALKEMEKKEDEHK